MTLKTHHTDKASDLNLPSYNLLCLRREHDLRHQHDVNLALSLRPRERGEELN